MPDSKSKVFQILSNLNRVEIKHLKNYIDSEQHGYPAEIRPIFGLFLKSLNNDKPFPDNQTILKKLSSKKQLTDQDVRLFKSYILKAAEYILVSQEVQHSDGLYNLLLSKALNKKGIVQVAAKSHENAMVQIDRNPYRNAEYFSNRFKLLEEMYKNQKNSSRVDYDFESTYKSLDVYYLSERFRLLTQLQNYKQILGKSYNDLNLSLILEDIENRSEFLNEPCIAIYYYTYKILENPESEELFIPLMSYIESSVSLFPKDEFRDILLTVNNFCIRKINEGKPEYLEKSFNIYQLGITSGALLEKGFLSRFTFKNIITLGIRLKEYDWTASFIEQNYTLLEKRYQESSYAYNRAYLDYSLKQYDSAILLLQKSDDDDVLISLSARNLLMKIYYELGYIDPLESLLGSMSAYLKRKNPEKIYKDNYTNIINSAKKLISLQRLTFSQKKTLNDRKEKVRQYIHNQKPLTEKSWLLEQLDNIKQ